MALSPVLSVAPLLALDGSPELGRGFKEGQISLPGSAVRPQLVSWSLGS